MCFNLVNGYFTYKMYPKLPKLHLAFQDGHTPVYISAQNGHIETCTLLIEHKADVNAATKVLICMINILLKLYFIVYLCEKKRFKHNERSILEESDNVNLENIRK